MQEQHQVCCVHQGSTNGGWFKVSDEVAHTKVVIIGFRDIWKSLKLKEPREQQQQQYQMPAPSKAWAGVYILYKQKIKPTDTYTTKGDVYTHTVRLPSDQFRSLYSTLVCITPVEALFSCISSVALFVIIASTTRLQAEKCCYNPTPAWSLLSSFTY